MFTPKIVGVANGASAGWGNLGGGATQLIMPVLFTIISKCGLPDFEAWRVAFLIPGCMHILIGFLCLQFAQDLPDGQYAQLKGKGKAAQDKGWVVIYYALINYRTWVLCLTYGYCFGVELTVDNVITNYYYDRFHIDLNTAGAIGASFGLMNFFSRPLGGILSDLAAKHFGMRGRIWHLWILQTLGGVFCIALGKMNNLGSSVVMLLFFSFCCQAACGATFGVVPFVSRRSLGIISGLVGAGGSAGSAVTTAIFFGPKVTYSTQNGIYYMGIMIICVTSLILTLWFPQWGGMFLPASKKPTATEEEYYASEYSKGEREQGLHDGAMKFAENSKGERGPSKAAQATAAEKDLGVHGKNSVSEAAKV
jgi:NNP family nitrate/nitrite transporter-like MFS transporter